MCLERLGTGCLRQEDVHEQGDAFFFSLQELSVAVVVVVVTVRKDNRDQTLMSLQQETLRGHS